MHKKGSKVLTLNTRQCLSFKTYENQGFRAFIIDSGGVNILYYNFFMIMVFLNTNNETHSIGKK